MADPDLQISGGDGEGGSPDIRTELVSKNFCFRSLGPQFGLKISGKGGTPPLDPQFYHSRDVRRSAAH